MKHVTMILSMFGLVVASVLDQVKVGDRVDIIWNTDVTVDVS